MVAGTAVWSWRATKAQVATLPAPVAGITAELVDGAPLPTADEIAGKVMEQLKPHLQGPAA